MDRLALADLIEDRRLNAILAWLLVGVVVLNAAERLLAGDRLWALFAASVAVVVLIPTAAYRSPRTMVPWEVLAIAALPILGGSVVGEVGELATYLAVAALALVVAVELEAFTAVEMTEGFAVAFVVVVTLATAGVWAVVRWVADRYLATGFIAGQEALMWEFVASTVAGLLAGAVFELYFRRRTRLHRRRVDGERDRPTGGGEAQ